MKIKRAFFERHAKSQPAEYMQEILSHSTQDGLFLRFDPKAYNALRKKYGSPLSQPSFGLGDAVAAVAQPIARALDAAFGSNIANCEGCAQRRDALNRLVPRL